MESVKPIITVCQYGKIKINLKDIIEKKHISRNKLAALTGTRFEVVNKWCNGTVERIDSDVLARFCYVLNCNVGDIISYEL